MKAGDVVPTRPEVCGWGSRHKCQERELVLRRDGEDLLWLCKAHHGWLRTWARRAVACKLCNGRRCRDCRPKLGLR